MPDITTYQNFTAGEVYVGQIDSADVRANLAWFRVKYEKDYLLKVLGKTLYDSFMAGLSADPIITKWATLKTKVTPALVCYIYYYYQENEITNTVGAGEAKPAIKNAMLASANGKMVRAWNEMVNETCDLIEWLDDNVADYPHPDQYRCDYDILTEYMNQFNL